MSFQIKCFLGLAFFGNISFPSPFLAAHLGQQLDRNKCALLLMGPSPCPFSFQLVGDKHRMSYPETVDEILDVSEDEGIIFVDEVRLYPLRHPSEPLKNQLGRPASCKHSLLTKSFLSDDLK